KKSKGKNVQVTNSTKESRSSINSSSQPQASPMNAAEKNLISRRKGAESSQYKEQNPIDEDITIHKDQDIEEENGEDLDSEVKELEEMRDGNYLIPVNWDPSDIQKAIDYARTKTKGKRPSECEELTVNLRKKPRNMLLDAKLNKLLDAKLNKLLDAKLNKLLDASQR
ncbi:hypothetical protein RUND412_004870, partial [Rhizina undulata]